MSDKIGIPRNPETMVQLASVMGERALKAEAEAARLRSENERLTADYAELQHEYTLLNMERQRMGLDLAAAEASADKAAEDMRERAAAVADIARMQREQLYAENNASINAHKAAQAEEIAAAIRSLASLPKESADA